MYKRRVFLRCIATNLEPSSTCHASPNGLKAQRSITQGNAVGKNDNRSHTQQLIEATEKYANLYAAQQNNYFETKFSDYHSFFMNA